MRQIQCSIYAVHPGEVVVIAVEAIKVGLFVVLAFNGAPISPISLSPLTFRVTIAAAPGEVDFAVVSCHFPGCASDDASYQLFLTGSDGGVPSPGRIFRPAMLFGIVISPLVACELPRSRCCHGALRPTLRCAHLRFTADRLPLTRHWRSGEYPAN
jgi:hypothetical protein